MFTWTTTHWLLKPTVASLAHSVDPGSTSMASRNQFEGTRSGMGLLETPTSSLELADPLSSQETTTQRLAKGS